MEITVTRTNAEDSGYRELIPILDAELKKRDGDEHAFYDQYNKSDGIKHVVLAYAAGMPVGCGAIKGYAPGTAELKRMFVPLSWRGQGIASQVLKELEAWAAELHFTELILETGTAMPEAIGLYKKHGYGLIPNYGQYAGKALSVCMSKNI
jgi:putative acetyltransferase